MHAVSGTHWGADRVMLRRLYTMLVRSRLNYGSVLYNSACEGTLDKLNTIQNTALRVITGARKTSPILSLQVEAHVMPLSLHRKLKLCNYYSRIAELPVDSPLVSGNFATIKEDLQRKWSQRNVPPSLLNALNAVQSLGVQPVSALHCDLVSPFPPWCSIDNIETHFADVAVKDLSPGQVQRLFKSMISTKYGGFLEIYTDGSKLEESDTPNSTAAALVVPQEHTGQGWLLDSRISVMGAELYGIWRALNWVIDHSQRVCHYRGIVICSDSLSSLLLCRNKSPTSSKYMVYEVQKLLRDIETLLPIKIQWIPAHRGIEGNESADRLANEAHTYFTLTPSKVSREDSDREMRKQMFSLWERDWIAQVETSNKGQHLRAIRSNIGFWPWSNSKSRLMETTLARLRIGHVGLMKHLHRIKRADSDKCSCGAVETLEHFLLHCGLQDGPQQILVAALANISVVPTVASLLGGGDYAALVQLAYISASGRLGTL